MKGSNLGAAFVSDSDKIHTQTQRRSQKGLENFPTKNLFHVNHARSPRRSLIKSEHGNSILARLFFCSLPAA